ncbi:hypothetical protein RND81_10G118400 [Saponaria officinalis]|uniref:Proline-rich protein n=1 Tax=Saponaria officinalis TaxID=3572 RepID=A0AAW1I3K4_SAPOF
MALFNQKFINNLLYLFILITISCHTIIARENINIARNLEESNIIDDPSIKCDTCPCDTCPEPIPPPPPVYYSPPPPEIVYYSPPPPVECPPPPSPPPPPKEPPCYPCMGAYAPPPPRFSYTPGNDLYVTEYNYNGASRIDVVKGILVLFGVVLLQFSIML